MADIVKDATEYRIKQIELAEANYYKELTKALDRIERRVIGLADTDLPRQEGKLIELQAAIAIRPKIGPAKNETKSISNKLNSFAETLIMFTSPQIAVETA